LHLKILTYNFADGLITNSKGSKESLKKILFKKKNFDYIYNPYLKKINKKNNFTRKKYILSVGRLTKQKDFSNLIFSFRLITNQIPEYKLIIVGGGNLKTDLIKLRNKLGNKIKRQMNYFKNKLKCPELKYSELDSQK